MAEGIPVPDIPKTLEFVKEVVKKFLDGKERLL